MSNINWFPGHMAQAKRLLSEELKSVDVIIEVLDARLPLSFSSVDVDFVNTNKIRVAVLNKCDVADPVVNKMWLAHYKHLNVLAVLVDSISGVGMERVFSTLDEVSRVRYSKMNKILRQNKCLKLMVAGAPNVGKSSFINKFVGRSITKTANLPGVTRKPQWVKLKDKNMLLLDTPGILQSKFFDNEIAKKVAYIGCIKDSILDTEELCCGLLEFIRDNYLKLLNLRFEYDFAAMSGREILETIGRRRGCIMPGGVVDTLRASSLVLKDFRAAKFGKISLEKPGTRYYSASRR